MCGIAGVASRTPLDPEIIRSMCLAISHRGPDDLGVKVWSDHHLGLGHTRLSIIDLSAAGRNPMPNEDGTVWIVFNGEIYNYQNLRQELTKLGHIFTSHADTEVIIHAYEQWGDAHVHRLRGMFAYALYDRREEVLASNNGSTAYRMLLVRDRLGIKPLFYYWDGDEFIFGSEIKAILARPGVDRDIDRSAIFDYLTYRYVPGPKTVYARVRKLLPGHMLVFQGAEPQIRQYWDVPLDRPHSVRTEADAIESVHEALVDSVNLHMVSDVPVGVFLSGGIDSSIVTALMARTTSEPVQTFTIGFDVKEHSETEYARLVAQHCQTKHREQSVGVSTVQGMLARILQMYDEPYADGSALPTSLVSSLARESVKVVLSGDGGDEVFAGYNWYGAWLKRRSLDKLPQFARQHMFAGLDAGWPTGWRGKQFISDMALSPLEQYARLMELFSPAEKRRLLGEEWAHEFAGYDDYWYLRKYWREDVDPLTQVQYLDLKTYLPDDILTKVDRASMAASLEVRPPLVDHLLIERLFSIPSRFRIYNGNKKYLLKRAAKKYLPEPILNRSKKGFSVPWKTWLAIEQNWAEQVLGSANGHKNLLPFQTAKLPGLFESGKKVWALLVLRQWAGKVGLTQNQ